MSDTPAVTDHQQFITRLQRSLDDGSFARLLLGRPHGQAPTLHKLLARELQLRCDIEEFMDTQPPADIDEAIDRA